MSIPQGLQKIFLLEGLTFCDRYRLEARGERDIWRSYNIITICRPTHSIYPKKWNERATTRLHSSI